MPANSRPRRNALGILLVVVAAVAVAAFTQQAAAAQLAELMAGLWVSVMSTIIRLFGG